MSSHIHTGPWVNWSQGLVLGATVTFRDRSGGLLTSFIATFITLVGTQLWRVVCYAIHQVRSNHNPQDGLHHQQQVVFRNVATPGAAAWTFTQQAWYWRSKAKLSMLRTVPWAFFSLFYLILFALAAIFSSEISKAPGSARLLIGDTCGYFHLNDSDPNSLSAYQQKITHDSLTAATYARACYGDVSNPAQCGRYPVPSIPWTADQNSTCPFGSGMCYYGQTAAYKMTSNVIDSQQDLGINTPERSRLQYERAVTCAPIHTRNFTSIVNGSTANGPGVDGDTIIRYNLGPVYDASAGENITDWTLQYNTHSYLDSFGYTLNAYQAFAEGPADSYIPIHELNVSHADLSLIFIAGNAIRFEEPCHDPVFAATYNPYPNSSYGGFYTSDNWVSTIACSETHKICNSYNNVCTPSLGAFELWPYLVANVASMDLDALQIAIGGRISNAAIYTAIYHATYTRMASALRAQETVTQLDQGSLPNNQWMIEVGSWFDASLARLQQGVQEYATGPSLLPEGSYIWQPNDVADRALCYSQIVRESQDTMSFSVLGMLILFLIGGIILFTSLFIEKIVGWIQKKWDIGIQKRTAWQVDDKLQLQRLLFSETGAGIWSKSTEDPIPVTETKEKIFGVGAVQQGSGYGPVQQQQQQQSTGYVAYSPSDSIGPHEMEHGKAMGVHVYER